MKKTTLDLISSNDNECNEKKNSSFDLKQDDWLIQQFSYLIRKKIDFFSTSKEKIEYLNKITNSAFDLENSRVKVNDYQINSNLFDNLTLPEIFNKNLFKRIREELCSCEEAIFISPFISDALKDLMKYPDDFNELECLTIYTTTYDKNKINVNFDVLEAINNNCENKIKIKIEDVTNNEGRLHSKIYFFKRKNGMSSLYVGSSNLSNRGLKTGNEFTIKISEFNNKSIFDKFNEYIKTLNLQENMIDLENDLKINEIKERIAMQSEMWSHIHEMIRKYEENLNNKQSLNDKVVDSYKLYDYQVEAIETLIQRYNDGQRKHLVVMATGTGKTVVALKYVNEIAKRLDWKKPRVLFLAHRSEILEQTKKIFVEMCDYEEDDILELYGGKNPNSNLFKKHLIIASVQTLRNYKDLLQDVHFDLVIMDEVHHVDKEAKTFLDLFKMVSNNSVEVLGLTATPVRTNGNDVSAYFDGEGYAINLPLFNAIEKNYLAPFDYFMMFSEDFADFDIINETEKLTKFLNSANKMKIIKEIISTNIGNENVEASCLIFCSSIENAKYVKESLKIDNFKVEVLTSEISKNDRESILKSFKEGNINYLCVVDIFNEGVDIPKINNIIFLRPTSSALVFTQQLGRGLRKEAGKRLNVFDIVNNVNVKKNKNLNPLIYLKEIANFSHQTIIIDNPKALNDYLPSPCNFWISKINAANLSKLLNDFKKVNEKNVEKEKLRFLEVESNPKTYELYAKYMLDNFHNPIDFYSKKTTFTKPNNKLFARILHLISLINISDIIKNFIYITNEKKQCTSQLINNLFLKSYYHAGNRPQYLGIDSLDAAWKNIFEDVNEYFVEIIWLLKYKLENTFIIEANVKENLDYSRELTLFAQQIGVLFPKDIFNELRNKAHQSGVNVRDEFVIIRTGAKAKAFKYENILDLDKKTLKWSAPSGWRIKTSSASKKAIESKTSKFYIFFSFDKDNLTDRDQIYTLLGKVKNVNGPFEYINGELYYELTYG